MLSQEKNVTTLKAVIEAGDFAKEVAKTYDKLSRNASVPGFRRGKAPKKVLDLRFGKEAILAEALEELLPSVLGELTNDYDLSLIEDPDVKIDVLEDGKDVELTIVFEVEPEVSLADLAEITVTQPKFTIDDKNVDSAIDDLRRKQSTTETVFRASASGDTVIAEYSTVIVDDDGAEIASHPAETHSFDLNEENLRPEIYQALLGVEAGDERETEVSIAEDYKDEKLAGKKARYRFTVKEIQERILPEMDVEFFKKVLGEDVEDEAGFRERIAAQLQEHMDAEGRQYAENEMVMKAVQGSSVEVPSSMTNRQKEHLKKGMEEQGQELPDDDAMQARAENDVKQFLVLEAYAKDLAVEVTKEDLDGEFERLSKNYGVGVDVIRSAFIKNRERIEEMANSIKMTKTLKGMMEKVSIEEKAIGNSEEA